MSLSCHLTFLMSQRAIPIGGICEKIYPILLQSKFERVRFHTVCATVAKDLASAALGCLLPIFGHLREMNRARDEDGALLLLDEVMCCRIVLGLYAPG